MNKKLKRICGTALVLLPLHVFASSMNAYDTIAGLGTEIIIENVQSEAEALLTLIPPFGPESDFTVKADNNGNATVRIPGSHLEGAGIYSARVDANGESAEAQFEVLPDSVDPQQSSIQVSHGTLVPDGMDSVNITVIARDRFGNLLPGRAFSVLSQRSGDSISARTNETDARGEQLFSLSTTVPGSITVRAVDLLSGKALTGEANVNAGDVRQSIGGYATAAYQDSAYYPSYTQTMYPSYGSQYGKTSANGRALYAPQRNPYTAQLAAPFGPLAGFEIIVPLQIAANEDTNMTIRAIDSLGNTVEDYTGMVLLRSTDPNAFLPLGGEIAFRPQDLGQKMLTLGLRFRTGGEHVLSAEDSSNPLITSEITVLVTGDGTGTTERTITITSHEPNARVSTRNIELAGESAPFINLLITGGETDVRSETDQNGLFSAPIVLTDGMTEHTLRVRDDSGRYDSGNVHFTLDNTPPEIEDVTFSPDEPESDGEVLVVVKSEPALTSVTLSIGDEEIPLSENSAASGSYQATFTAPGHGTLQPAITATDSAGNARELRTTLVVKPQSLPTVQNLRGESVSNTAELTWDAVEGDVDTYRVYVGLSADDFLYTLDTDTPVTSAIVTGLSQATTYYFAVTAVEGERESAEKSDILEITVEGIALKVTAEDSSLLLEWNPMQKSIPLSSYLLEYGVEEGVFTEQRIINGELQRYVLRDLLNGIVYYLRLTPVAVTGDILRDSSALGQGMPGSERTGFHPSANEPLPFIPGQGQTNVHPGAPRTPTTGIPFQYKGLALAFTTLGFGFYIHRRRKMRQMQDFLQSMKSRYHS